MKFLRNNLFAPFVLSFDLVLHRTFEIKNEVLKLSCFYTYTKEINKTRESIFSIIFIYINCVYKAISV